MAGADVYGHNFSSSAKEPVRMRRSLLRLRASSLTPHEDVHEKQLTTLTALTVSISVVLLFSVFLCFLLWWKRRLPSSGLPLTNVPNISTAARTAMVRQSKPPHMLIMVVQPGNEVLCAQKVEEASTSRRGTPPKMRKSSSFPGISVPCSSLYRSSLQQSSSRIQLALPPSGSAAGSFLHRALTMRSFEHMWLPVSRDATRAINMGLHQVSAGHKWRDGNRWNSRYHKSHSSLRKGQGSNCSDRLAKGIDTAMEARGPILRPVGLSDSDRSGGALIPNLAFLIDGATLIGRASMECIFVAYPRTDKAISHEDQGSQSCIISISGCHFIEYSLHSIRSLISVH